MSEKINNGKIKLTEFLKYRRNEMSDRERNAFEKELQKDPFLEEAAEGFSKIEPEEAERDMNDLYKQLKGNYKKGKGFIFYRIAASVAVLMIISSVFIVLDRGGSTKLSEAVIQPDTFEIHGPDPIKMPVSPQAVPRKKSPEKIQEKKVEALSQYPEESTSMKSIASRTEEKAAEKPDSELIADTEFDEISRLAEVAPSSGINDTFVAASEQGEYRSKKRIAVRSASGIRASLTPDYLSPLPEIGLDSFNIYIEKNIRIPEGHPDGQSAVVMLTFNVGLDGKIDRIKIISTPGKAYSDEAIRLLKEGPRWQPSKAGDKNSGEKATLNIVFR
jgi:hypothetical protein